MDHSWHIAASRFEDLTVTHLPRELRTAIDQLPAALLESVGPLGLSAPDTSSALHAVEEFVD